MMANFESPGQVSASMQGKPGYSPGDDKLAQVEDGVQKEQGQIMGRLGQVWQRTQERLGMGDNRQPAPSLGEELRHGQQEMLDIGRSLADVAQDLQMLLQQEMMLARVEMQQQLRRSKRAVGWGTVALVFMSLKLGFLAVAGMFALALVLPFWLSALIVAGALFAVEAIAWLVVYRQIRQLNLVPQQTMESVKEDIRWISSQLKSNGQ